MNPTLKDVLPTFGSICMGGYPQGISGCEFFFPLRDCHDLKGRFPVFGRILNGLDELKRIEQVETVPVPFPDPGIVINRPVYPEIITHVDVEFNGYIQQAPKKILKFDRPETW